MESSLVKEYKEKLTNEYIKALEEKGLNWKKDWIDNYKICENAYGKGYKSFLNNIIVVIISSKKCSISGGTTFQQPWNDVPRPSEHRCAVI